VAAQPDGIGVIPELAGTTGHSPRDVSTDATTGMAAVACDFRSISGILAVGTAIVFLVRDHAVARGMFAFLSF
jgi:hypothetical protein